MKLSLNEYGNGKPSLFIKREDLINLVRQRLALNVAWDRYGGKEKFEEVVRLAIRKLMEKYKKKGIEIRFEEKGHLT